MPLNFTKEKNECYFTKKWVHSSRSVCLIWFHEKTPQMAKFHVMFYKLSKSSSYFDEEWGFWPLGKRYWLSGKVLLHLFLMTMTTFRGCSHTSSSTVLEKKSKTQVVGVIAHLDGHLHKQNAPHLPRSSCLCKTGGKKTRSVWKSILLSYY